MKNPAGVSATTAMVLRAALLVAVAGRYAAAQTWTRVTPLAPGAVNQLILLSDGTVMAAANSGGASIGNGWYRLTPDSHGSYVNGTWSTLASMHDSRLYYASQVLRDGRVFVAGGEYGTGGAKAEVYNPLTNTWTNAPVPTALLNPAQTSPATGGFQAFDDACSETLPDGTVLISPVEPRTNGQTLIYDPASNAWSNGPMLFRGIYQAEATWLKLPDNSILTIDPYGTSCERFIPSLNAWINDTSVPTSMYDTWVNELGGALLLPNGKALFIGSTGHTALYTPSGTTAPGAWVTGPTFPSARGAPDAPAAMLVTGNVLCAVGVAPTNTNPFVPPTWFYEYNSTSNTLSPVAAPGGGASDNIAVYATMMLNLPDGSVLYSHFGRDVWVYRPSGSALTAGRPVILGSSPNADGSRHLTGTGFNGWSEGATYGDDAQMNSNYPLVRLVSDAGNACYARTFNWSSTGVATGALPVSTEYRVPGGVPSGRYTAVVVANGIASEPLCATPPTLSSQPSPRAVCTNDPGVMSVDAAPGVDGTLSYQWQYIGGAAPASASVWTDLDEGPNFSTGVFTLNAAGAKAPTLTVDRGPTPWAPAVRLPYSPYRFRCVVVNDCGVAVTDAVKLMVTPADVGNAGGLAGADGVYDNNDFMAYIVFFFGSDPRADVGTAGGLLGSDGVYDNNDFVSFINLFFAGC